MANGASKRNKLKNWKEVNYIWRIECILTIAKTEISTKLILKKVQKLAGKLHAFPI